MYDMLIRPTLEELESFGDPDYVIYNAGQFPAAHETTGLSPTTVDLSFEDREEGHRLLLDAGPVCPDSLPAHGQADTFTFELHIGGCPFVVDAGLFEYAPGEMRDWCRSTRAHSATNASGSGR